MKFNKIAFPQEHGSWGFFLEPIVLALIVGYSQNGLLLAVSSFFIFLAHQPVRIIFDKKIGTKDKNKAIILILIYSGISLLSFWKVFSEIHFWNLLPYVMAIFLMAGFLFVELNTRKENFVARLIPPLAVCLIAISIVSFANSDVAFITAFYWVLLGRSATTSIYIHEKLKKLRKEKFNYLRIYIIHSVFFIVLSFFIYKGYAPFFSIVALSVLTFRAVVGLKNKGKTNVRKIGLWEFAHGIIYVLIVSLGYLFNI